MPADTKKRLGRGLNSLIKVDLPAEASNNGNGDAVVQPPEAAKGEPLLIPLNDIQPNPHQPRRDFKENELEELAASIRSNGVIQPVVVCRVSNGYQLIAGERRLRASKLAGVDNIPAIIREADEAAQAELALIENIQRSDLNPIERALGYKNILNKLGITQEGLARQLGESRSSIANFLRLLELHPEVQNLVVAGRLSFGHAKLLAGIGDFTQQIDIAQQIVNQGLSVRNVENLLASPTSEPPVPTEQAVDDGTNPARSAHILDVEKRLARVLGMRVKISPAKGKASKGKLTVQYANLEQFDELAEKLGLNLNDD